MADSTRELIFKNIKSILEAITVANGYNNDFTSETIQRWQQRGNTTRVVPCIIINAGPEEYQPAPSPYYTAKLTVYLDVWQRQQEGDTVPTDTLLNALLADVIKAILVDETRGGNAVDTDIVSCVPFETVEGQPMCGIIVELEIMYQFIPSNL
ncbi:MAG: hypothetical protein ABIH47_09160 [Candidatus Omnitrophota bacterium]